MQFACGWEIFTSNPAAYMAVNFKVVNDLFHAGSTLVESECIEVQIKCFFIAEFERAVKIRKIAVYRFLISLPVPELQRFKVTVPDFGD